MGLIDQLTGRTATAVGDAVEGVAEVFHENETTRMEVDAEIRQAAMQAAAAEFQAASGRFDAFVNALNRLPRPMMALGTLGLFVFAMVAPEAFTVRMQGLAVVPEPLWWLLGAVVSFYFGARELHYARAPRAAAAAAAVAVSRREGGGPITRFVRRLREGDRPGDADTQPDAGSTIATVQPEANPALAELREG